MNLDEFEAFVFNVFERLPDWVHDALDNIQVLVLEEPDERHKGLGPDLLGLYTGVPLPERGVDYAGELPDVIYLFRKPHLALGLDDQALREEIATTLIHEVAHYFGIDDHHLDEIGWG